MPVQVDFRVAVDAEVRVYLGNTDSERILFYLPFCLEAFGSSICFDQFAGMTVILLNICLGVGGSLFTSKTMGHLAVLGVKGLMIFIFLQFQHGFFGVFAVENMLKCVRNFFEIFSCWDAIGKFFTDFYSSLCC